MRTFVLPRIAEPQYVPQQRVACRERVSERASGRTGEQASMSQDKTRQSRETAALCDLRRQTTRLRVVPAMRR
jgi:hypothetical protein